jgi:hypothetical protein
MADEGTEALCKTAGSDKMLQCEPLSVILGIRPSGTACSGVRRMEKLSGSCRPVPSPVSLH